MHFNMNIISTTAVAALLLASIESAESMDPSNMPKTYLNYPMGVKGAFGLPRLELSTITKRNNIVDYLEGKWDGKPATITCVDPNHVYGRRINSFYRRHRSPSYSGTVDEQTKEGAKYFGNVVANPSPSIMECYVIDNACKYTYEQHVKNLRWKIFKKQSSLDKTINQIIAAVKYAQAIGVRYMLTFENVCFDANENLLMQQHNDVIPLDQATLLQRGEGNLHIYNLIYDLERTVNSRTSPKSIGDRVDLITQSIQYPIILSSPSSNRRNSISNIAPPPPFDSRRNSLSGSFSSSPSDSRRGSISGTDPVPPYNP